MTSWTQGSAPLAVSSTSGKARYGSSLEVPHWVGEPAVEESNDISEWGLGGSNFNDPIISFPPLKWEQPRMLLFAGWHLPCIWPPVWEGHHPKILGTTGAMHCSSGDEEEHYHCSPNPGGGSLPPGLCRHYSCLRSPWWSLCHTRCCSASTWKTQQNSVSTLSSGLQIVVPTSCL